MKMKSTAKASQKKSPAEKEVKENSFPIVAIGSSAGGLEAMTALLKNLPPDTGMAFIYVQHLSPDHKSMLVEILSKHTEMQVQEIDDMEKIKPDNVFVIPHNKAIEVTDGKIKLLPRSKTSLAITIDILFTSLAESNRERVIGIVLSGSASDGTHGIKAIKHLGGITFAQDDTAQFTSMPHSAIASGAVDFILSPKEIARELTRLSKHPFVKALIEDSTEGKEVKEGKDNLIDDNNPHLKNILTQILKATGVDFTAYKMNTIKRRILRRMLLHKVKTLQEYEKVLNGKMDEINILYQDLLINVTSFFREKETYAYLKSTLFPALLKRKKSGGLRIWVPACATGEEAYSMAMMLIELEGSKTNGVPVQIFATDISEPSIVKARIGIYTKQELEMLAPKRIQRFFTKSEGSYRINKEVRDMCVFAPHNILRDPPFSRLDFISCCNLFIYLDVSAQKKAIITFHYALSEGGFLMLGKSESISHSTRFFAPFNNKYKIFLRKMGSGELPVNSTRLSQQTFHAKSNWVKDVPKAPKTKEVRYNGLDSAIDEVMVSEFMPPSVVINHQMEIVQFRGSTDLYFTHPKGKATFNILKMARPDIAFELRSTISKVLQTKQRVRKSGIEIKVKAETKLISMEVLPLKIEWDEPLLLVLFTEQELPEMMKETGKGGKKDFVLRDKRIKKLEEELTTAHADALALSHEQEAFAEELQSANEEVVSSNEELQTLNEELETSKEEIESANEELITTNQELKIRNDLLTESYDYSDAVISTMYEAMIVLDKNLRVKSANRAFYKKFEVTEEETEGVLLFELGNKQWNIPGLRKLLIDIIPHNSQFSDFEVTHTFLDIGEKIMSLNARRILQPSNREELILLVMADITAVRHLIVEKELREKELLTNQLHERKKEKEKLEKAVKERTVELQQANAELKKEKEFSETIFNTTPDLIGVWDSELRFISYNKACADLFQVKREDIIGKKLGDIFPSAKGGQSEKDLLRALKGETLHIAFHHSPISGKYYEMFITPLRNTEGEIYAVVAIAHDITENVNATEKIKQNEDKFNSLFKLSPFNITLTDAETAKFTDANETLLKTFGYTRDEFIGKTSAELNFIDQNIRAKIVEKLIADGTLRNEELVLTTKSGKKITVLASADNIIINGKKYLLSALNDITDRKKAEAKVELKNLELQKMNKELEAFNYISSHDLQEPLRKIQTFAGRLLEKENKNLSESGKDYFNRMREAALKMQTLIHDLLAFSRLNSANRKFEITDLNEIAKLVRAEYQEAIKERNAIIEIGKMCKARIIPFQFRQLMENLIGNALKFSKPKTPSHIIIKSEVLKSYTPFGGREACHITVSDNGIGFEKKFNETIFGLFQKLHGNDEYQGTGIGLAIVKKIVDNHNGIITVTSELGKGATFDIYIPAS